MKNTIKRFFLVFICFLLIAAAANAATVYKQDPISWSHSNNNSWLIADDFKLEGTALISQVAWWGKYDTTNNYEIIFYSDMVDAVNDNHEPGTVLKSYLNTVSKTLYDTDCFIFSVSGLDFTADAHTSYWISIKPINASGWTGWRPASSPTVQYGAQYTYYDSTDGWEPYTFDPNYHHDLAFELYGDPVPIPSAVWLLGSGLIGLVSVRRQIRRGVI